MADKNFIAACQELKEFLGAKLSKEAAKAKITEVYEKHGITKPGMEYITIEVMGDKLTSSSLKKLIDKHTSYLTSENKNQMAEDLKKKKEEDAKNKELEEKDKEKDDKDAKNKELEEKEKAAKEKEEADKEKADKEKAEAEKKEKEEKDKEQSEKDKAEKDKEAKELEEKKKREEQDKDKDPNEQNKDANEPEQSSKKGFTLRLQFTQEFLKHLPNELGNAREMIISNIIIQASAQGIKEDQLNRPCTGFTEKNAFGPDEQMSVAGGKTILDVMADNVLANVFNLDKQALMGQSSAQKDQNGASPQATSTTISSDGSGKVTEDATPDPLDFENMTDMDILNSYNEKGFISPQEEEFLKSIGYDSAEAFLQIASQFVGPTKSR